MTPAYKRELWAIRHRFCNDTPGPIAALEEAQWVLTAHAGHGCLQHLAAQARASEVLS